MFNKLVKGIPLRWSYECICCIEVESRSGYLIRGYTGVSTGTPAISNLCNFHKLLQMFLGRGLQWRTISILVCYSRNNLDDRGRYEGIAAGPKSCCIKK